MVPVMKFREVFLGLGLSSGTLLAHSFAGGTRITGFEFLAVLLLMFLIGYLLSGFQMEGPILASAIVISQMFGHFVISDTDVASRAMMASHIATGVITYFILKYADSLISWFWQQILKFPKRFKFGKIEVLANFRISASGKIYAFREFARSWSPAPPLSLIN